LAACLVAVEPLPEVADWIRSRSTALGITVAVEGDLPAASSRIGGRPGTVLAGFFNGHGRFLPDRGGGARVVPFLHDSGTVEDHLRRWDLLLQAVVGGVDPAGVVVGALPWADLSTDQAREERHRRLILGLEPVFDELTRRDPLTREHSFRVGLYAARIGESLGLSPPEVRLLHLGGWVHDVGKIRIDAPLLTKSGALTPEEMGTIRLHPLWGSEIVQEQPAEDEIYWMVRAHHERFDGQGYPDGLRGGAIAPLARVLAVADTYDAITSDRAYRKASGHRAAVREILANSGTQFDPEVVQAFLAARLDRMI